MLKWNPVFYTKAKGSNLILSIGTLFAAVFTGGMAVDTGFYFAIHQKMQNAADSSALAAVNQFYRSASSTLSGKESDAIDTAQSLAETNDESLNVSDVEFGYVDPVTRQYDAANFTTVPATSSFTTANGYSTNGYNAVRVTVKAGTGQANAPITTFFTKALGIDELNANAQSVAMFGSASPSAVRPLFMCKAAFDQAVSQYGDASIPQVTLSSNMQSQIETSGNLSKNPTPVLAAEIQIQSSPYQYQYQYQGGPGGSTQVQCQSQPSHSQYQYQGLASSGSPTTSMTVGSKTFSTCACQLAGAGNWGILNFANNGSSPNTSAVNTQLLNGYSGTVTPGNYYQSISGNSINTYNASLQTLANNKTVIPVVLYSNTTYPNGLHASDVVYFQISSVSTAGSNKSITGHFKTGACPTCSVSNNTPYNGISKILLVH